MYNREWPWHALEITSSRCRDVDAFAALRLTIGATVLCVAAGNDLRTRRASDRWWIALGTVGLVLLVIQLIVERADAASIAVVGSAALLFYAIFFGKPIMDRDGFHLRPARVGLFLFAGALFILPAALHSALGQGVPLETLELYSMPAMVAIYQGLYWARLLHGGADAKGLIALTLLVPAYPDASPFPLVAMNPRVEGLFRTVFPFSLVVWVDALVLFLAVPVGLLLANVIRGDLALPQAFLGYRARVDAFPRFAWPMEKIDDRGQHVLVLFPKRGSRPEEDLARLRAAGIERVWVTPQIPFLVLLLGGFVLAFFAGNLLLAIVGLGG
jgi:archaeal preflagellin peptidase FlaK